ncbi:MAG: type II secretion system protein [Verrucomicrobiota bacterium]
MSLLLPQDDSSHRGAFTLAELLTTMVIIAILVSLLSAALNHTKTRALQVTCLSNNLKQLQFAWFMYIDDNDNRLPLNQTDPEPVDHRIFGWKNSTNSWVVGSPKEDLTTENIKKGTLFPYVKAPELYRCPLDRSTVAGHDAVLRTRSYAMNAYLNGDQAGPRVKTRFSELVNPTPEKVFVFIEEHEKSLWAGTFFVVPRENFSLTGGSWISTPADRHDQGCNLSFADGHTEYWRWYWPKTANLDNKLTSNSKELLDLRRLQAALPRP